MAPVKWRPLLPITLFACVSMACGKGASGPVGRAPDGIFLEQWNEDISEGDPRVAVPGAQTTIARLMPRFRRCFERLNATGKVSLVLTVDNEGRVSRARTTGPVPREVAQCVERNARLTLFSPPEGGKSARLDVPVAIYAQ